MDDLHISMKVEHCFYNLSENSTSSELSYLTIRELLNVFSQTNTLDVISYKVYLFWTVDEIMQINHTGVIQTL